jgi:hypothetical protein
MYKLSKLEIKDVLILMPSDLINKKDYNEAGEQKLIIIDKITLDDFSYSISEREMLLKSQMVVFVDRNIGASKILKTGILKKIDLYDFNKGKEALSAQILSDKKVEEIAKKDFQINN